MKTRVLFIIGWGRSGSTLLDMAIGSFPGIVSTGELSALWEAGWVRHDPCGCGQPLQECPVWRPILRRVTFDAGVDPLRMADLRRNHSRERHTLGLLRRARKGSVSGSLREYVVAMNRLYTELAESTGAEIVVDSSKVSSDAAMLLLMPDVEPHFVHLVRDPRATAYSWKEAKDQPQNHQSVPMPRYGVAYSTIRWLIRNLGAELLLKLIKSPSVRLRYEDFVADPGEELKRILEMMGTTTDFTWATGSKLNAAPNHSVSGNPLRVQSGPIEIRCDDRSRTGLTTGQHWVTTLIALPLLHHYSYSLGHS